MNLARFLKKNVVFLVVLLTALLFISLFIKKESFYNSSARKRSCNFNYCSGDFEVVNNECFKKCSSIKSGYFAARSNPMICKESETSIKTFSRNFNSFKKKNRQNNSGCECPTVYTKENGTNNCIADVIENPKWGSQLCSEKYNGSVIKNICYYCPRINDYYYPRLKNNKCVI